MTLADENNLEFAFHLFNAHIEDTPCVGFDYEGFDSLKHEAFSEAVKKRKGGYVDVMSQGNVAELFNPSVHLSQFVIEGVVLVADLEGLPATNGEGLPQRRTIIRIRILDSLFSLLKGDGYAGLDTLP